jgi:hypothetical protein
MREWHSAHACLNGTWRSRREVTLLEGDSLSRAIEVVLATRAGLSVEQIARDLGDRHGGIVVGTDAIQKALSKLARGGRVDVRRAPDSTVERWSLREHASRAITSRRSPEQDREQAVADTAEVWESVRKLLFSFEELPVEDLLRKLRSSFRGRGAEIGEMVSANNPGLAWRQEGRRTLVGLAHPYLPPEALEARIRSDLRNSETELVVVRRLDVIDTPQVAEMPPRESTELDLLRIDFVGAAASHESWLSFPVSDDDLWLRVRTFALAPDPQRVLPLIPGRLAQSRPVFAVIRDSDADAAARLALRVLIEAMRHEPADLKVLVWNAPSEASGHCCVERKPDIVCVSFERSERAKVRHTGSFVTWKSTP